MIMEWDGQMLVIERIGTDGDVRRAMAAIREWDGRAAAIGLGGIDRYLYVGGRRYVFRQAERLARLAHKTPVVDGSGLKHTLERRVVRQLAEDPQVALRRKNVLLVSAVDRFGMAETLVAEGCRVTFGDLMFGLGIPVPLHSLQTLNRMGHVLGPVVTQLPIHWLYPTGQRQEQIRPKYRRVYRRADVIAGDFHYIRRHLPERLEGVWILTNTVTREDEELLRRRGAGGLITTTPEWEGRSFGTNVLEAVFVAMAGEPPALLGSGRNLYPDESFYHYWLERLGVRPRITCWGAGVD
ncbi:quinate 5-dehydrogenase [Kyrpidia spormannii]|uniref:Quinate 5-dehydrogenase n=2 Tax=Kyrpidia spormannii TaxID=2055160 RepID=A0A2K8N277_9BACL|nr:quinate 5-dehydrogenase [Kyrpidia spormannii]